jgi:hypothetical protein
MGVVTSLCAKAIWIDQGSIHDFGSPEEVVGRYLVHVAPSQNRSIMLDEFPRQAWLADDRLRLLSLEWISSLPLQHGKPASLRLHFETRAPVSGVWLTVGFDNRNGGRILTYRMVSAARDLPRPGKYWIDLLIDPMILGPDIYQLDIGCRSGDFHTLDFVSHCVQFEVVGGPNTPASIAQNGPGVQLEGAWSWSAQSWTEDKLTQ